MTKNWRNTLTDYSPAYNPNDWTALSDRLQASAPRQVWKRILLLSLAALAMFSSGFVVRGFFANGSLVLSSEKKELSQELGSITSENILETTDIEQYAKEQIATNSFSTQTGSTTEAVSNNTQKNRATLPFENPWKSEVRSLASIGEQASGASYNVAPRHHSYTSGYNAKEQTKGAFGTLTSSTLSLANEEQPAPSPPGTTQNSNEDALTASLYLEENTGPIASLDSAKSETIALKDITTPETTEIGLTLSPFFQTSQMKKLTHLSTFSATDNPLFAAHEVGIDFQLNNMLYAGVGYGYRFWNEGIDEVSKYRAHAPFLRAGVEFPIYKGFHLLAQTGASIIIEKLEYEQQRVVDGIPTKVIETLSGTSNSAQYSLGALYSFTPSHSVYSLLETGERRFTIGYKYQFAGK